MKNNTHKTIFHLLKLMVIISLTLFVGCNNKEKQQLDESEKIVESQQLAESICLVTSEGCSRIISQGVKLPTSFSETMTNDEDNQEQLAIELYQGENAKSELNRRLGEVDIPIKKTGKAGKIHIQVTIMIDQSKKISLVVKDFESGYQDEFLVGVVN